MMMIPWNGNLLMWTAAMNDKLVVCRDDRSRGITIMSWIAAPGHQATTVTVMMMMVVVVMMMRRASMVNIVICKFSYDLNVLFACYVYC